MTFIVQPKKEGETKECDSCGMDLVGRWTDYKGKWEDKLQWQTIEPRKAHYTKDGDCKESITTEGTQTESTQQEITTSSGTQEGNITPEQNNELKALSLKIDEIYAMIKVQFDEYQERKTNENL